MTRKGWAWPLNARAAHFFIAGRSLCGRWIFFGRVSPDDGRDGPLDCKTCSRKIKKLREAGEV